MTSKTIPNLIYPGDLARKLGVAQRTVVRWCMYGMPHARIQNGRYIHRVIDPAEAAGWLAKYPPTCMKPQQRRRIIEFVQAELWKNNSCITD